MENGRKFGFSRMRLVVSLFLVCLVVLFSLSTCFMAPEPAYAATNVDTFAELKAACQKSGTVQITAKIAVTETITIPKGVTVYLTCTHDAGSTTTDIYRAQGFHGHLFKVNDGATLYVRCAIDGNNKDGSGNLRGTGATGTESSGYYGQALILNYGNVIMDNANSVLKNNYNAYNNDYKTGLLWTYNSVKYYGLGSGGDGETDLAGSAILCVNGSFTMSNGHIYGCIADNGPAIYVCNGYAGDVVKISGGKIHDNVARRYGGAIFAASRKAYSSYSNSSSFVGSRTLNSTGSNAMVTVSGGSIYKNVAKLNSGAVWVGFGGTFYMSGGSIYSNVAVEEGGGGLRLNAGGAGTTGGWMCFANPGGQAWIAGGSIYSNTCATNGGGITVPDNDDANNQLKITGGNIYSNTAGSNGGGVYVASKLVQSAGNIRNNTASGNGGGVYLTGTGTLTMSGGSVYSNTATDHGGGIYLTTAGPACTISGGNIYSNKAAYGGGVATLRTNGLTISNAKIYNNNATTNGGGVRSTGKLTVNSGFVYGNTNIGLYVAGGTATINGGKFGVSAYTDYSTYTVARNTVSQITTAAGTTTTINSTSYPRIVSSLADGEAIGANKGIVNNGTLTVTNTSANAFDIYGTGTSVYNTGTLNINGNFNILSSGKDGTTTVQKRLGIQNTATGTVTMNSADAEIKYCGCRGVVNNGTFTLKAGKIYNNTSADVTVDNGGGICVSGDDSAFNMSGGEIYNNSANYGGGVYFTTSGAAATFSGGSIYGNTATKSGGGIGNSRTAGLTLSGCDVYSNKAGYGGGVYNAGVLNLKGSDIYSNEAVDSHGGGIYVTGDNSVLTMTSGTVHDNTAKTHGGGIYFTTNGKASAVSGGSIYRNKAGGSGGGLFTVRTNGATISGGSIYENSAVTYGGGVYVSACPVTLTGGTIHTNTADTDKGNGVFVAGEATFKMSKAASVNTNNDVFLNSYNYITVPEKFTGTQNVRALVTGDNFSVGRVIAKYGNGTTDAGSNALYWNATAPKMAEQYFSVKGKVLRSGDQGAADVSSSGIVDADVFLSDQYTLSFNGNLSGVNVTVPSSVSKYWNETKTVTFADAKADVTYYTFTGWNTKADGSGNSYTSPMTYATNMNLTLYAQWKGISYTVKYNGNGSTGGSTASSSHVYGVAKNLTANGFTRTGYTFNGWNTKADGSGTAYADKASVINLATTAGATVNLYAQWKPITYTVQYNGNGSTGGSTASSSHTYDVAKALTANGFTRTGYTFNGWNTKADGSGTAYADKASVKNLTSTAGGTVTLYAQWKPISYTVQYNGNGSTGGSTASSTHTYDVAKALTANGFTRTGYAFNGWNTKADGSGTAYADKASVKNLTSTAGGTVTLYAQWKPITYTVQYNGNGSTSGSTASSTHTYGVSKALTANGFTRTGYTFTGWNTKADGSGTAYTDKQSVINLASTQGATVTLYAQWSPGAYTVKYDGNGSTGGSTASSIHTIGVAKNLTANGFTRTGYTFNGWNTKADGSGTAYADKASVKNLTTTPGATVTLYAQWKPITYTIVYNGNGSTSGSTASSTHTYDVAKALTANGFTRTGYTFNGWNTKADGTGTAYADKASVKNLTATAGGTVTLYAQWKPITYTVKYEGNGATSGSTAPSTHTYDVAKSLTANGFTRTGYTFNGWNTKADGSGTSYADKASVKNLSSTAGATVTLYAQWSPGTYTVKYDGNGSTGGSTASSTHTIDVAKNLTANGYTKTGYAFNGWNTKADGTGTAYADKASVKNLTLIPGATVTLYAQWKPITYTIVYNGNGSTGGSTASSTHTYDVAKALTANGFTRTGYSFNGWNSKADGSGTAYTDKQSVKNLTSTAGGTVTLYAQWKPITYTVQYNGNGSTGGSMASSTHTYDVAKALTANGFTRTGYTFDGWNTKSDGSGTAYADKASVKNLTSTAGGTVTLYAQWKPITYTVKYDGNGSTGGATASSTHTYDVAKNLTANGFTKTGYGFAGWNTKADGSGTAYADQASVKNLTSTAGATITLYAQWKPITYTVKYDGNGATGGSTASSTHTYDVAKTLTANGYTRTGYSFAGWNTKADGTGTAYADKQSVKNLTATAGATVTLYAQWSVNTITVVYHSNDATGRLYKGNAITEDYLVNNLKSVFQYSIAYAAGLMDMEDDSGLHLSKTGHSSTGYWLVGSADGTVRIAPNTAYTGKALAEAMGYSLDTESITVHVYAEWFAHGGTIYFYPNGGTATGSYPLLTSGTYAGASSATQSFTYLDTAKDIYDVTTLFQKKGYHVVSTEKAWLLGSADASSYVSQAAHDFSPYVKDSTGSVLKLYANWAPNTYSIVYDGNGATGGSTETSLHVYDTEKKLTPNGFTKTAYLFAGWNTQPDGSGTTFTDEQAVKNLTDVQGKVITLYAMWIDDIDEGPVITAVDRWFTREEAQNGEITFSELMSTATAEDSMVGNYTDFAAGEGTFTILDFNAAEFMAFTSSGSTTITYYAQDFRGNEDFETVTVYIIDVDNVEDSTVGEQAWRQIRFVSDRYYLNDIGTAIDEVNGGLRAVSKWLTDSSCFNLLSSVLANQKVGGAWTGGVAYSFDFTADEIAEMRESILSNGPGNNLLAFFEKFLN